METLLIAVSDFSERVDISTHVADKYIDRHIITAQERFLRGLLGADFYAELIEEKATGYWTGLNETLVDTYITPYLVWRSYQIYIPQSGTFFTGMGPRHMTEDNSVMASHESLAQLTDLARNNAKFFESELYKYLMANKDIFVTWYDACDRVKPSALPKLTGVGKMSRRDRLTYGPLFYSKEED